MKDILYESKDCLQTRLKTADKLLKMADSYIRATDSMLSILDSRISNKNMWDKLDDISVYASPILLYFCHSLVLTVKGLLTFVTKVGYKDTNFDRLITYFPAQDNLIKKLGKYLDYKSLGTIEQKLLELNGFKSVDELYNTLRETYDKINGKGEKINYNFNWTLYCYMGIPPVKKVDQLRKDLIDIKNQSDFLSSKLKRALELKNYDDPDEVKEDYYDRIREIKSIFYEYCGIDIYMTDSDEKDYKEYFEEYVEEYYADCYKENYDKF